MRIFTLTACIAALLSGCQRTEPAKVKAESTSGKSEAADEIATERAKLTTEDRAAVEAQEWCAINTEERLGSMGAPIKIEIKGQPVFICCKGCKRKAEADADKTLATVERLKVKAKAEKTSNR
jgi:hypothetical protein